MDSFSWYDRPDLAGSVSDPLWKHWLSFLESLAGPNLLVVGSAISGQSGFQSGFHPADVWSSIFVVGCHRHLVGLANHRMDDRCGSQATTGGCGGSDTLSDLGIDRHGAAVVDHVAESLIWVG